MNGRIFDIIICIFFVFAYFDFLYNFFFAAQRLSKMRVIMFLAWLLLPYLTVVHGAIELVGQAIKGKLHGSSETL